METSTVGTVSLSITYFAIRTPTGPCLSKSNGNGQRGNTYEWACKFMMPGILNSIWRIGNQPPGLIPVWWIFADVVASDFRDRREILHWLQGIDSHVLLWENIKDYRPVVDHFEEHIQPFLS